MHALGQLGTIDDHHWDTLQPRPSHAGYCVRETDGEFRHSSIKETLLRFIGVMFVLSALVQWTFPNANFVGDPMMSKSLLSIAFALIGMAAYRFAMKGHRAEIRFDGKSRTIVLCALNRRDQQKGARKLPLRDITSIYVRRTDMAAGKAALRIRLKSGGAELTALRGDLAEVEAVHALLCSKIRKAQQG
ncbi:hypothetical protein [Shimia sp. MIT1388]|uniref:hypothetical protein n=1 Tax=Shimia sp. MIT1388 TaxID=3096992 RepID=UPI00399B1F94